MTIRDAQREIRKNDFLKGAISARTALAAKPKGVKGSVGATVARHPAGTAVITSGGLILLGAGGKTAYDRTKQKKVVAKALDKEDKASLVLGGGAGAAVMPMRAPKPRGSRKDQIDQLRADVKASGAKSGDKVDITLNPSQATRISEKSGIRAQNGSYSAKMAVEREFPESKRYETALYDDGATRQLGGRHYLASQAMKGEDVKARVHVQSGSRPAEPTAVQALLRPLKGARERRDLSHQISSPEATLSRRAGRHKSSKINEGIARIADKEGEVRIKPGLTKEGVRRLHGKQAAYIAGGAGGAYVLNRVARSKDKHPTAAIANRADRSLDMARDKTADVIKPNSKKELVPVEKGIKMNKKTLKPIATAVGAGTVGGVIANQLPQNQRDSRKIVKKRDDRDRYAAGAVGATAGAALMPVRDAGGHYDKKFARKHAKNIKESGTYDLPSKDLQSIAAPGRRPHNIGYTDRMAQDMAEGRYNPKPVTVRLYDDAGKTAGGAHRTQARAYAQQPTQRVNVERVRGYYPETKRGAEAAVYRARRVIQPTRFMRATPGSKKELAERASKVTDAMQQTADKKSTDTPHPPSKPGWTLKQLRAHKGKQAAFLAGGTALAVGANEYRRNNVYKSLTPIEKAMVPNWSNASSAADPRLFQHKVYVPTRLKSQRKWDLMDADDRAHIKMAAGSKGINPRGQINSRSFSLVRNSADDARDRARYKNSVRRQRERDGLKVSPVKARTDRAGEVAWNWGERGQTGHYNDVTKRLTPISKMSMKLNRAVASHVFPGAEDLKEINHVANGKPITTLTGKHKGASFSIDSHAKNDKQAVIVGRDTRNNRTGMEFWSSRPNPYQKRGYPNALPQLNRDQTDQIPYRKWGTADMKKTGKHGKTDPPGVYREDLAGGRIRRKLVSMNKPAPSDRSTDVSRGLGNDPDRLITPDGVRFDNGPLHYKWGVQKSLTPISKARIPVPGRPSAILHPIKRMQWGADQAARRAGQNFTQGAADAVKANVPKVDVNGAVNAVKGGGKAVGAGIAGAGLIAGASKVVGDAMKASSATKAAKESTKRAQMYTAGGVAGAGLIGGGLALNGRKK